MIKEYDVRKDSSSVQSDQHRKIMALHRTELEEREREKKKTWITPSTWIKYLMYSHKPCLVHFFPSFFSLEIFIKLNFRFERCLKKKNPLSSVQLVQTEQRQSGSSDQVNK